MTLKTVTDVVWSFYYDGRAKATAQTLDKLDFKQGCLLAFAGLMRAMYVKSKSSDSFNEPDYSFVSPLLTVRRFPLEDLNTRGARRADMCGVDLLRLPKGAHFTNVYPVGTDCGGQMINEITQVEPGEENFYLTPDFSGFQFFVVKGKGLDTYNIPPCIKSLDIETTYSSDDMEISLDMAYEVVMSVLSVGLKVNGVPVKILDNNYSPQSREVKQKLQDAETNL